MMVLDHENIEDADVGTLYDASRAQAVSAARASAVFHATSARLVHQAIQASGATTSIIALVGDRQLEVVSQTGVVGIIPATWSGPISRTVAGTVVQRTSTQVIQDIREHAQFRADPFVTAGWQAILAIPITDNNAQTIGVLAVGNARPRHWSPSIQATLESLAHELRHSLSPYPAPESDNNASSKTPWLIVDTELRVVGVNASALHGIPTMSTVEVGQSLHDIVGPLRNILAHTIMHATSSPPGDNIEWQDTDSGQWYEFTTERSLRGIGIFVNDITRWKARETDLLHAAYHDPLTGLPNRRLLMDRLNRALAHGQRKHHVVAVVFIDLDDFKQINDHRGHEVGDEVLTEVARRLSATLRNEDTAARLGGDEFVVVLPDVTDQSGAIEATRRIVQALREPVRIQSADLPVTASIGIALSSDDGNTAESLLRAADKAMYEAKQRGKNQFRMHSAVRRERTVRAETFPRDNSGITAHYQPQMDLVSGELVAYEALARWEHPTRSLLEASEIIPLARRSGLIIDLGLHVFSRACQDMIHAADGAEVPVQPLRINLSAEEVADREFPERLAQVADAHEYPLDLLTIELDERDVLAVPDLALLLRRLSDMGIAIAVDNATLYRTRPEALRALHITEIGLAMSMVAATDHDPNAAIRAAGIIALAHLAGIVVIAKGVERRQQLEFFARLGCDRAQGFFIARPGAHLQLGATPRAITMT